MTLPLQRSRETVELDVDFDAEIACTIRATPPCPNPARWLGVARCCGDRAHWCDEHLAKKHRRFRQVFEDGAPVPQRCTCGVVLASFDAWVRLVRL